MVVSGKFPVKITSSEAEFTQRGWSGIGPSTVGTGFTIIVIVSGSPSQPFNVGTTVIVAV